MAKRAVRIIYERCEPGQCAAGDEDGRCPACGACRKRVLVQLDVGDPPAAVPGGRCRGCSDCVEACPLGAVRVIEA